MIDRFQITNNSVSGTHLTGYFSCSYQDLVKNFGEPQHGDMYKVTSEWRFLDVKSKKVVTLYDYKETSLYESDLPSVDEFRSLSRYDWHIGADSAAIADEFIEFLNSKLQFL